MPDDVPSPACVHLSGVKPPAPSALGSKARDDWIRWKEDWRDYSIIQDIPSKAAEIQLAFFRVALGPEGKKILRNQPVPLQHDGTTMDLNKVATLLAVMQAAVVGEVNDTYERYVFRCRMQHSDETVDEFITSLRELIKTCNICEHMHDHFLKDQVIFGLQDATTREKLLQELALTLNKCLDMSRAAESAAKQAKEIGAGAQAEVNRIDFNNKTSGGSPGSLSKSGPAGPHSANAGYKGKWKQQRHYCVRLVNNSRINSSKLSNQYQSAYKKIHSSEIAFLKIHNDILSPMDNGKVTVYHTMTTILFY